MARLPPGPANALDPGTGRRAGYDRISEEHSPRTGSISAWIDPRLKWPVQLTMEDGTSIDLENIRERPQPVALFGIPSGYRKFDPRALLERIKQSDVWVEPPHK